MIKPLRQRHRRIFAILAVALPVAFVLGMAARRPAPTVNSLPREITAPNRDFSAIQWSRDDVFARVKIQVSSLRERGEGGRFAVAFVAPQDFVKPDLLVYWTSRVAGITDRIPEDAVLLGSFNNFTPLPLPGPVAKGVLILYSLADHEIVEISQPIDFAAP